MKRKSVEEAVELGATLAGQLAQHAAEADLLGKLRGEDVRLLQESGYLALSVPEEYGGWGLPLQGCVAAHLELARGSAAAAMVAAMPLHVMGSASEFHRWPPAMFERLCRAVVEGGIVNYVASEPLLGSPSRGGLPETTAVPSARGDGYILNGHKTWTTGGDHLTHLLVRARIGDEPAVLLVLGDSPGVEWVETWRTALSLRASQSDDVYFRDVLVPAEHLLEYGRSEEAPRPNAWFPTMMAAVYLGAALAARDAVIRYALERVPVALGRPIATLPKIQRQIGEIDMALQAAQALLLSAAADWSREVNLQRQAYPRIIAAKEFVARTAAEVTEQALRVAGGLSLTPALPLERHFRDTRAAFMQPPSGDTALELIGRGALDAAQEDKTDRRNE